MSERIHTLTVVLEKDMHEEDVEGLSKAICRLRGVLTVRGHVANLDSMMAEERAQHELRQKIVDILWPPSKPR